MDTVLLILTLPLDEGEETAQKPGSFNTPDKELPLPSWTLKPGGYFTYHQV